MQLIKMTTSKECDITYGNIWLMENYMMRQLVRTTYKFNNGLKYGGKING